MNKSLTLSAVLIAISMGFVAPVFADGAANEFNHEDVHKAKTDPAFREYVRENPCQYGVEVRIAAGLGGSIPRACW